MFEANPMNTFDGYGRKTTPLLTEQEQYKELPSTPEEEEMWIEMTKKGIQNGKDTTS